MIISRVVLRDYGAYAGTCEFDLEPAEGRPVVLVGGMNGAGKTTLFESVRLCLYGAPPRMGKKAYHDMLRSLIHRGPGGRRTGASVKVRLRLSRGGEESEYTVERSWTGDRIDERLEVSRGPPGGPAVRLDTVERAHWQSFLGDLVPRGIAELFFFDGEKIARMAESGEQEAVREAFRSLLGIELAEQLADDLRVGAARRLSGPDAELRKEFEACRAEAKEGGEAAARLREALARKRGELDSALAGIESAESRIRRVGGGFAERREQTVRMLAEKKSARQDRARRLAELCSGALPFSTVPRHMESLVGRLREGEEARRRAAGHGAASAQLSRIGGACGDQFWKGAGLSDADAARASGALARLLEAMREEAPPDPPPGPSEEQAAWMRSVAAEAELAAQELAELASEISELDAQIAPLERSLASAPRDDELGRLVSEAGALRAQEGQLRAEMEHIEQKISASLALARHAESKLRGVSDRIYRAERAGTASELSGRVQGVLEEFARALTAKKAKILEGHLSEALRILLRKKGFVDGARVDPQTLRVSVRAGGKELPSEGLSKGERQMLATAVLWALARTSGRPLPFMIDTPLARLDAAHRSNIVEKFLPSASHQVVVFSTDSEIDQERHRALLPHIARSYSVDYDGRSCSTVVREGYFWGGGRG